MLGREQTPQDRRLAARWGPHENCSQVTQAADNNECCNTHEFFAEELHGNYYALGVILAG